MLVHPLSVEGEKVKGKAPRYAKTDSAGSSVSEFGAATSFVAVAHAAVVHATLVLAVFAHAV